MLVSALLKPFIATETEAPLSTASSDAKVFEHSTAVDPADRLSWSQAYRAPVR
jgi:hypothetical protein